MDGGKYLNAVRWILSGVMAFFFVFVTVMMTWPSEEALQQSHPIHSAATWPDGSPRTDHDWWAKPAAVPPVKSGRT